MIICSIEDIKIKLASGTPLTDVERELLLEVL